MIKQESAGKPRIGGPFQLMDLNGKTFSDRCTPIAALVSLKSGQTFLKAALLKAALLRQG